MPKSPNVAVYLNDDALRIDLFQLFKIKPQVNFQRNQMYQILQAFM